MSDDKRLLKTYLSSRSFLKRLVSRIVPPDEIEDIVQETYVRICKVRSPAQIREPQAFMVRTARNLALDHLKKSENRLVSARDVDAPQAGAWTSGDDNTFAQAATDEEFSMFCEAVRRLPVQCRRVFVLKKVYGHTQKEIARNLQISESTVEKHIAKGMKACIRFLDANPGTTSETPGETKHSKDSSA